MEKQWGGGVCVTDRAHARQGWPDGLEIMCHARFSLGDFIKSRAILHCARLEGNYTQCLLLTGVWAGARISIGGWSLANGIVGLWETKVSKKRDLGHPHFLLIQASATRRFLTLLVSASPVRSACPSRFSESAGLPVSVQTA